jgi:hypothetical protein
MLLQAAVAFRQRRLKTIHEAPPFRPTVERLNAAAMNSSAEPLLPGNRVCARVTRRTATQPGRMSFSNFPALDVVQVATHFLSDIRAPSRGAGECQHDAGLPDEKLATMCSSCLRTVPHFAYDSAPAEPCDMQAKPDGSRPTA